LASIPNPNLKLQPVSDPTVEPKVDYEAELGVVIGATCRNVSEKDSLNFVLGYVVVNDVSGRYSQFEAAVGGQWSRAKSYDTFRCVVRDS